MQCSACSGCLTTRFSPRLADLGDAKLWRIDRRAGYGPFNSLGKGTINLALIQENWPDVIRLAGSLKLGHLKAAGIMRTLQRLPGTRLGLCLAQRDQVAPDITPAVNLNEAGKGHWHHSGSSSASPATSSLSVGEMCRHPQSGQSSSTWQDQVSDHS